MAHEFIDRRWPLQVVIRQWNEVPLEYELRGTLDATPTLSCSIGCVELTRVRLRAIGFVYDGKQIGRAHV